MIITELMGGLGNQMFQYAAGRSLAKHHNTSLKLDLSFLQERYLKEKVIQRDYELEIFNISQDFANQKDLDNYTKAPSNILEKLKRKFVKYNYLYESNFHYQDIFKESGSNCYLHGFWQSEKYFKSIEAIIRNDFTFKNAPGSHNVFIISEMQKLNSVSLHVRRGDFVTDPETKKFHGSCSPDYYNQAMRNIEEKVSDPSYFIFSDDIDWVKENMVIEGKATYINQNFGSQSFEDMRLMSSCRHNIIANSSFSWWGAWLNPNPDKIVIAPAKWFNSDKYDYRDVVPETWTRIA